jgi:methyltransferase-like protein/2-polyprenyl-3-methyl-5-hydroxy-6-metoxy-1,4-benzoquinol methylase
MKPVIEPYSTSYDEIPYPATAYSQSHVARLETLAKLFGMSPADIRRSRVLELGCADGSNLIPMACALPESSFLGVDLSARQIKAGQEIIAALGFPNIELRQCDICNVDQSVGAFDYVIAHGVYSWVPAEVQEKILNVCRENLRDNGVAYVSYNTYPGWRMRGMLRDMMVYHARKFDDAKEKIAQARALIQWLGESIKSDNNPYGMLLKSELEQMQHWQDAYFRHDSLAEINEPVYFHEFVERAEAHGLQYLAEAEFPSMLASNYAAPVAEALDRFGRDIIEMEQYMDFVRNRMFRQTLLCHREVKLSRALGPWTPAGFRIAASLRQLNPGPNHGLCEVEIFEGANDSQISTGEPVVKAALVILGEAWPATIPFRDLLERAGSRERTKGTDEKWKPRDAEADSNALGSALLACCAKGLCEFRVQPEQFVTSPGKRPGVCSLVRLQAARGNDVTNRRHERLQLGKFERQLVPLLDGKHDRTELIEELTVLATDGTLNVSVDDQVVTDSAEVRKFVTIALEDALQRLSHAAILIG